jgi:hypothetical protein
LIGKRSCSLQFVSLDGDAMFRCSWRAVPAAASTGGNESFRGPAGEARAAIANPVSRPTCGLDTRFKDAELLNIRSSALAMACLELRANAPFQCGVP